MTFPRRYILEVKMCSSYDYTVYESIYLIDYCPGKYIHRYISTHTKSIIVDSYISKVLKFILWLVLWRFYMKYFTISLHNTYTYIHLHIGQSISYIFTKTLALSFSLHFSPVFYIARILGYPLCYLLIEDHDFDNFQ